MPDENGQQQQDAGRDAGQQSASNKYNPSTLDDATKIIAALQKRLEERDSELGGAKQRLTAFEQAQQKALEEQGNYKTLADQRAAELERLKPAAERMATLEQIIRQSNEERVKQIPETMRGLVPSDYAPERLQEWLNKNAAMLTKQPAPNFDAGAGGSGGRSAASLTPEEIQAAKMAGISQEEFLKAKTKRLGG
jgi:hypothetical protein